MGKENKEIGDWRSEIGHQEEERTGKNRDNDTIPDYPGLVVHKEVLTGLGDIEKTVAGGFGKKDLKVLKFQIGSEKSPLDLGTLSEPEKFGLVQEGKGNAARNVYLNAQDRYNMGKSNPSIFDKVFIYFAKKAGIQENSGVSV